MVRTNVIRKVKFYKNKKNQSKQSTAKKRVNEKDPADVQK
jgi:hypothetical protein